MRRPHRFVALGGDRVFYAASKLRRRQYTECIDICTQMLETNPFDQAVWYLKCQALTAESWIDDTEMEEEGIAEVLLDQNAMAEAPRPGTSLSRPHTNQASGPSPSVRPMTAGGRPLTGYARPGTGQRPQTGAVGEAFQVGRRRKLRSRDGESLIVVSSHCRRAAARAHHGRSQPRGASCGSERRRCAPRAAGRSSAHPNALYIVPRGDSALNLRGRPAAQFINVDRLDLRKYAQRPALAKILCDYILYHLHNPRKALELCSLATVTHLPRLAHSSFCFRPFALPPFRPASVAMETEPCEQVQVEYKDWWWKARLGKCYYQLGLTREAEKQFPVPPPPPSPAVPSHHGLTRGFGSLC
jgi:tetratricopeptide repeat protein 8